MGLCRRPRAAEERRARGPLCEGLARNHWGFAATLEAGPVLKCLAHGR